MNTRNIHFKTDLDKLGMKKVRLIKFFDIHNSKDEETRTEHLISKNLNENHKQSLVSTDLDSANGYK